MYLILLFEVEYIKRLMELLFAGSKIGARYHSGNSTMLQLMVLGSRDHEDVEPDPTFAEAVGAALEAKDRYRFNFSYVVDRTTMMPVRPVLEYLTYSASNRSNSGATIKNKADACYELFLYLDAIDLDYRDICLATLVEYKERLSAYISPKTKRPLAAGTVKDRLQICRDFCEYHRLLEPRAAKAIVGRPAYGSISVYQTEPDSELHIKNNSSLVEYVNTKDLSMLMSALAGEPGEDNCPYSRDWLVSAFCLTTGARISETLGLNLGQISAAYKSIKDNKTAVIRLVKTKGSKPRDIIVDRDLITFLKGYIEGPRKKALKIGQVHRHASREVKSVFVNGSDCAPCYAGLPYSAKRAEEHFASVQIRIGMVRTVPVYDLETREPIGERQVNRYRIHHLRHTYAIQSWHAYRRLPEIDRWIKIQGQLGHKSHEVTASIYLRAVKHLEGDARDVMGTYLKSLTGIQ